MPEKKPSICQKIRNRAQKWDKYFKMNRDNYHEWMSFVMGGQWKEDESKLFERYNKIPLTMNKLNAIAVSIVAEQRQNTVQLEIMPDDTVPTETATTRSLLIKNISLDSNADIAYQHAYFCAVVGGYGAFGIDTAYDNDYNFDQSIKINKITDPTRCYWDIGADSVCKVDGMYAGFRTRMTRNRFRSLYGKTIEVNIPPSAYTDDTSLVFADDDSITIIDDFERKSRMTKLYYLSNGETVDSDEFAELQKIDVDGIEMIMFGDEPVTVYNTRSVPRYYVKHRQIAGDYVLDEREFPSESLPIMFVDQNSFFDKKGQQITRSFFEDVKDAQRNLNYIATQSAYLMKVLRYDQFIASKANVKGADTEQIWRDPSVVRGALLYDESPNGSVPQRLDPPELPQSFLLQYNRCLADIQSGVGIYDTQLGEQGNEISGAAINARTKRGTLSTFVSRDNLSRAVMACGVCVNEMIPKVYDTERQITLKSEDGNKLKVTLNKAKDEFGAGTENDMTEGSYKIRLIPGLSYEGQREQTLESLEKIFNYAPSSFGLLADLYADNLPADNKLQIRNRLKTIVSPAVIKAGETGEPLPPQPQQPSPDQLDYSLKQAELQQKARDSQAQFQLKLMELNQKQAEIERKAGESQQDMTAELAKLNTQRQEIEARMHEAQLRFMAEIHKTNAEAHVKHGANIVNLQKGSVE